MSDQDSGFQKGLRRGVYAALFVAGVVVVGLPMYEYSVAEAVFRLFLSVSVTFLAVTGLYATGIIGPREEARPHRINRWVSGLVAVTVIALLATECSSF